MTDNKYHDRQQLSHPHNGSREYSREFSPSPDHWVWFTCLPTIIINKACGTNQCLGLPWLASLSASTEPFKPSQTTVEGSCCPHHHLLPLPESAKLSPPSAERRRMKLAGSNYYLLSWDLCKRCKLFLSLARTPRSGKGDKKYTFPVS